MQLPKTLVFVRHAESEGNALATEAFTLHDDYEAGLAWLIAETQSHPNYNDWHLTPTGTEQAARLRAYLLHRFGPGYFDTVFTSSLARAQQTQQLALPDIEATPDGRIDEIPRGIFEHANHLVPQKPRPRAEIEMHLRRRDSFLRHLMGGAYAARRIIVFGHGAWMASLAIYPPAGLTCAVPAHGARVENTGIIVLRPQAAQPDIPERPCWRLIATEYNTLP